MKKLSLLIVVLLAFGLVSTFALKTDIGMTKLAGGATTELKINLDGVDPDGDAVTWGLKTSTSVAIEFNTDGGNAQVASTDPKKGVHGFVAIKNIKASMNWNGGEKTISTTTPSIEARIKFKPWFIILTSDNYWAGTMPWDRTYDTNMTAFRADLAFLTGGVRELLHTDGGEGPWWSFGPASWTIRNRVGVEYSTAGRIGFGYDSNKIKFDILVGTESADGLTSSTSGTETTWTGDGIAFGVNFFVSAIPNLALTGAATMGTKYGALKTYSDATPDVDLNKDAGNNPIGAGIRAEYTVQVAEGMAVIPAVAADIKINDDADSNLDYEVVGGASLAWQGGAKAWIHYPLYGYWGYQETSTAGLTVNFGYSDLGADENDPKMNLMLGFNNGDGGPIDPVIWGLIFEMINIDDSEQTHIHTALGIGCPINDIKVGSLSGSITPFLTVKTIPAYEEGAWDNFDQISLYVEAAISLIPGVGFNLNYSNTIHNDAGDAATAGTIKLSCSVNY